MRIEPASGGRCHAAWIRDRDAEIDVAEELSRPPAQSPIAVVAAVGAAEDRRRSGS
jgi:hypothetical protein